MKTKLLYVPILMAVMSALVVRNSESQTTWRTKTEHSGRNLEGKMFTVSRSGGVSFYAPNFYPASSSTPSYSTSRPWTSKTYTTTRPWTTAPRTTTTRPWTTAPRTTTTRPWTTRPWTTAPPTRGVSVCLRYLLEVQPSTATTIFTLSPSSRPLTLRLSYANYVMSIDPYGYSNIYLRPDIMTTSNIGSDLWTRVCLTIDSVKNVVQLFSGRNMSIRKLMSPRYVYVWSGEPVIDFSNSDGQVTDIQVWDYPLQSGEILRYMMNNIYGPIQGSVLTWSNVAYSPRGQTLLEDIYEWRAKQPVSTRRKRPRPKGEKKTRLFFNGEGRSKGKRQQL